MARAEPYRPDTIADGGSSFGLTVRAASVRGLQKRYSGGPRQDDLCLRLHEPTSTLVVAVADGVSGAARSDLAAALAVRHATAAVIRQLDRGAQLLDWGDVFEQAAWALVDEHRRDAGDPRAGVEDASASLATTLLVAAVAGAEPPATEPAGAAGDGERTGAAGDGERTGAAGDGERTGAAGDGERTGAAGDGERPEPTVSVQLAAVGDSPAFVLSGRVFMPVVGDAGSDDGLLVGAVKALPRAVHAVQEGACSLVGGSVLLLCTDGLALPLAGGAGEVGQALARELKRPPDIVDFARLLDFSRSTYDDDRTLVAIWCGR